MIVPELDAIATKDRRTAQFKGVAWSDDETDTLVRYYRKVPTNKLLEYLPGRTQSMIAAKFQQLRIRKKYASLCEENGIPRFGVKP